MREIKFRGKTVDTGNWVYGSYQADVMLIGKHTIIYLDYDGYYCEEEVIPETIGQYTGLNDRNGKEIYEGDIVETDLGKGIVVFDSAAFLIRNLEDDEYYGFEDFFSLHEGGCYLVEVIGNIFEHKHLLEVDS